jgi:outer membrane receptor protein involved in Fe transport
LVRRLIALDRRLTALCLLSEKTQEMKISTSRPAWPLLAGLTAALIPILAPAQDAPPTPAATQPPAEDINAQAAKLEQITVTGSRIPRAQVEGPAPVTVIKGSDIDAGGFRSVFDILSQVTQNTGMVQGEDFGSTFTPAANVINLRGLGPNHTLVLVNGHRVADYPIAYDGSVNAVDFANIPSVMIDRIEILSGSASAVYGSDAIAGVVNIILKQKHEGVDLSVKVGGTQQGGGDNQRIQLIGGGNWGDLSGVFGLELTNRAPIWYGDRSLTDSYTRYASPDSPIPPAMIAIRDPTSRTYYSLPCDTLGYLMNGSLSEFQRPRYHGTYCSSDHYYSNRTNQTKKKVATGYASLTYALNDSTQLFGDFMAGWSDVHTVVRNPSWASPSAFWNDATNRLESWTRILAPEEDGGRMSSARTFLQRSFNVTLGVKGTFGSSDWHYEVAANRSDYKSDQGIFRFLNGINDYFLGPQTGTHEFEGEEFPSYNADPSRLLTPLTADRFRSLSTHTLEHDKAWTEDLNFSVNGSLFQLPAGDVGVAAVVEAGRQGYSNVPDPRINAGQIWNVTSAVNDSGTRNRYAAGFELNVPIFSQLTGTAAARYDRYTYGGQEVAKSTYNLGLEYRPIESLLVRGTYSTSFRAPDMNYLFAKGTVGYEPGDTDFYQCRLEGQPYDSCDQQYNMNFRSSGNIKLKPENGKSFTYGLVWSPLSNLDFSADYYRIRINDEVTNLDSEIILRTEADCLVGQTQSGTPVDRNSSICQDAIARVVRNPANAPVNPNMVTNLLLNPINAATERTSGIDLSANFRWSTDRFGKYQLHGAFTHVLSHQYQQFPGDPVRDYVSDINYQSDWRTKVNAALSWGLGDWSATVDGTRYGRVPLNDVSGLRSSYMLFNGSVGYDLTDRAHLSLIVNNLRNSSPVDKSGGWPNYTAGWYDAYGRQWWVQFDYHFGAGKSGS